jgi:hypothetical protein
MKSADVHSRPAVPVSTSGHRIGAWALGVGGGIAAFMGAFILLADEDQWVGTGGSLSWRVGDVSPAWGYGLLGASVLTLIVVVAMVLHDHETGPRAAPAAIASGSVLIMHAVIFLVVNAFLWLQDIDLGGGLDYAYWTTIPWAVGLLAHALAWASSRRSDSPLGRG